MHESMSLGPPKMRGTRWPVLGSIFLGRLFVSFLVSKMKIGYRLISLMDDIVLVELKTKSSYKAEALSYEKPYVDFKEKFRSLDFFVSFFYQEKNESRVRGGNPLKSSK